MWDGTHLHIRSWSGFVSRIFQTSGIHTLNAFCPQNAFCYPQIYFYHLIFSWWLNRIIIRFWQCYNDCVTTLRNSGNSIDLDEQAPGLLMSSSIIPTFPTSYIWSHLLVGGYLWSSAIVGSIPKASINVVKFDNLEQLDRLYIYIVWLLQIKGEWQGVMNPKVYTAQLLASISGKEIKLWLWICNTET